MINTMDLKWLTKPQTVTLLHKTLMQDNNGELASTQSETKEDADHAGHSEPLKHSVTESAFNQVLTLFSLPSN